MSISRDSERARGRQLLPEPAPGFTPNVPQVQRRPYYNAFTYPDYTGPNAAQRDS